ncbi:50S ribosomal protein L11 methyltransferase [Staphylococcus sp. SQ8-PEA]|uniref:Ribosomal protein L11 methyltransferase n=1 Tax=Staphylococcus marylandisciuri TaxID=2981529 RepID=A0ABT2QQZ0_9STAP|nr:50S ribosomal protein L11 methyltransferase [Staphylococcus marylandisciuri]MCU5746396.1 50S ribosomal protein L11 methyltransferase [Staphylococcus marylandisciuri]
MKWTEVSITVNHEVMDNISQKLETMGSNGVVIEDSNDLNREFEDRYGEIYDLNPNDYPLQGVRLKAYFNQVDYNSHVEEEINTYLENLQQLDKHIYQLSTNTIDETDWENEWKNYFHPYRASEHFTIVPSWETYKKVEENELCIKLDPGMAFGTGDHPTTRMCLEAIETYVTPNASVIDVGTGSGILSVAAHLIGAHPIKAIDVDEMAINIAKDNFKQNYCDDCIETETTHLLSTENKRYDIVIANILAHIIEEMIDDAYNTLNEEGYFITSGIIDDKESSIVTQMKRIGFKIISINHDNGWVCIVGQKVSE